MTTDAERLLAAIFSDPTADEPAELPAPPVDSCGRYTVTPVSGGMPPVPIERYRAIMTGKLDSKGDEKVIMTRVEGPVSAGDWFMKNRGVRGKGTPAPSKRLPKDVRWAGNGTKLGENDFVEAWGPVLGPPVPMPETNKPAKGERFKADRAGEVPAWIREMVGPNEYTSRVWLPPTDGHRRRMLALPPAPGDAPMARTAAPKAAAKVGRAAPARTGVRIARLLALAKLRDRGMPNAILRCERCLEGDGGVNGKVRVYAIGAYHGRCRTRV